MEKEKCVNRYSTKIVGCRSEGCDNVVEINLRASANNILCNLCEVKNKFCVYCGKPALFRLRNGKYCCEKSWNSCSVNKESNSKALKAAYLSKSRANAGVATDDYSTVRHRKLSFIDVYDTTSPISDEVLNIQHKETVKKILIKERGYCCEVCKNTMWNNIPITLELEHVDGNNKNNFRQNLKLLCPNCHSQTPTWRRKKK